MQQQCKEIGMTVDLLTLDSTEINKRLVTGATADAPGDFDLFLNGGGVFRQDPNVSAKYLETVAATPVGAKEPSAKRLYEFTCGA